MYFPKTFVVGTLCGRNDDTVPIEHHFDSCSRVDIIVNVYLDLYRASHAFPLRGNRGLLERS